MALYRLLEPAKDRLKEYLLKQRVLGVDETRWPVFGKEPKNWTMWCMAVERAVLYDILEGRGGEQAQPFLRSVGSRDTNEVQGGFADSAVDPSNWRAQP